jgi:hypothetical protein
MVSEGMYVSYRVVCSENKDLYPGVIFIDICRDGFCSHDCMFKMRQHLNPGVERMFNDSRGIMLREARDGSINLVYTKHKDVMAQRAQEKKRKRVDHLIIEEFKKMKERGAVQTISVPSTQLQYVGEECKKSGKISSYQEEKAYKLLNKEERIARLKAIRSAYYENRKYAEAPHLRLMQEQRKYLGD